jgi:hypothetical protein
VTCTLIDIRADIQAGKTTLAVSLLNGALTQKGVRPLLIVPTQERAHWTVKLRAANRDRVTWASRLKVLIDCGDLWGWLAAYTPTLVILDDAETISDDLKNAIFEYLNNRPGPTQLVVIGR